VSLLGEHAAELGRTLELLPRLESELGSASTAIADAFGAGAKVLTAGNGGSAAEAQHLSSELVGRLSAARERAALPAVALHADTSTLTAVANDYGYEQVFARHVEALGRRGDVLVVLSTSGASKNLVAAVDRARDLELVTVGLLGQTPRVLHERCDHVLAVPSADAQVVQECHIVLIHVLVELVENELNLRATALT